MAAKWGLLAVTLIGIGVMLWARIDDRRIKYRAIRSSIEAVGVVEPLVVHPQAGGGYLLLDATCASTC
jgi:hypothetical protein